MGLDVARCIWIPPYAIMRLSRQGCFLDGTVVLAGGLRCPLDGENY